MTESFEVQLAIYDLSRGMARSLSAQFLGSDFAIGAIPHTGILVYGLEYFFDGRVGIESEDPQAFRRASGLLPIKIESLGRTTVTKAEFEHWCRQQMVEGRYNAAAYNLINRNCNNFSHDAALQGLRLPRGVPDWILEVPNRFISSPMGQIVRPMLESMQITGVSGAQPLMSQQTPTNSSHSSSAAAPNPWASNASTSSSSSQSGSSNRNVGTELLDSFAKPLISSDTKMVKLCADKLVPHLATEEERRALEQAVDILMSNGSLTSVLLKETLRLIQSCLEQGFQITFALLLLRIIVLQAPMDYLPTSLTWLYEELASGDLGALKSPASRATAWLTVANVAGSKYASRTPLLEKMVDLAVADVQRDAQPRPEIRQAAASFLYNIILLSSDDGSSGAPELDDLKVSSLCACIEGIAFEPDPTAQLRRLMVIGRIVKPRTSGGKWGVDQRAMVLLWDLGFQDVLRALQSSKGNAKDVEQTRKLASEMAQLLR